MWKDGRRKEGWEEQGMMGGAGNDGRRREVWEEKGRMGGEGKYGRMGGEGKYGRMGRGEGKIRKDTRNWKAGRGMA